MKTLCGKFSNLAHYFPYDAKLRLLAHSLSFLANRKARNAIVGAENITKVCCSHFSSVLKNDHSKSYLNIFRMSFCGNGPRIKESQLGDIKQVRSFFENK